LQFANPAALAMMGYRAESEVLGRHFKEFLPSDAASEVARLLGSWAREGARARHELRAFRKDGSIAELEIGVSPTVYEGEGALQFILRDVTERNALQQRAAQSAKLAAVSELVAGVAHELNNPLTGIVGYATLLAANPAAPTLREDLGKIAAEAQRAARIVRSLLTFARPQPPARRMTDLNALVQETLGLQAYRLRTSGVEVRLNLAPDLPPTAVDPPQIQQVLVNLVTNAEHAIAATRRPGRLTVATTRSGDRVEIRVADNGCGISSGNVGRIFDPFFTTKQPGEGTGLGLSLAYGIVRDHGGEIRVESEVNVGTTFTVALPIVGVEKPRPARSAQPTGDLPSRRWLIVDDEPTTLDVLRRALEAVGQQVSIAGGARQALDELARQPFDYVIADVRMPEMGGEDLKALIEERFPGLRGHVIFCTGDVANPRTQALIRSAALPVLEKPFEIAEVEEMLRSVLAALPQA